MKIVTLHFGEFRVMSYGNGWGYDVTDTKNGWHFWLQDDDAIQFRECAENDSWENACSEYMDLLGNITN